ncbi:MAG: response regulator, partial [Verrucomicrobia subdivision 3 bacterium]|nr:response regulator [Limisphaerales bacterium]
MSQKLKRVLFVDDNHEFLSIIENILGGYSQGIWEIFTAQHAGMAFHTIQEKQIDLVVVDVRMPVIDGLEFLTLLNRQHPNVAKAVMTGDVTDATRAACLSRGAEVFLQKPALPQDWQNIFKTLNEIGRTGSEDGFRGVLRRVGLQDVLQMECLSRNSSVLEVKARQIQGLIFIEAGQVVHAEVGQRMGEEAFNYLMGLSGGEFNLKPFSPPRAKTISIAWEFLLMEAARKRDEAGSASGVETGAPDAERMEPPPSTLDIGQAPAPPPSNSQLSDPFKS